MKLTFTFLDGQTLDVTATEVQFPSPGIRDRYVLLTEQGWRSINPAAVRDVLSDGALL